MHPELSADLLGQALAEDGWTVSSADHPAQDFDPEARIWNSPDRQLMLSAHGGRDGGHMITLYAPRAPQETEDPRWQIGGGPVPVSTALVMARAARAAPAGEGHAAALTKAGWTLAPEHVLSVSIAGLESWIGPTTDDEPTRFWSAFRFPMPTEELSTWAVKGAHAGTECSLVATAATPGEVIAAAAHRDAP